jgi:hypothetical protein
MLETGHAWEQNVTANGEVPEIIGAMDKTFLEPLLLVFLDLPKKDLLLEEASARGHDDASVDIFR